MERVQAIIEGMIVWTVIKFLIAWEMLKNPWPLFAIHPVAGLLALGLAVVILLSCLRDVMAGLGRLLGPPRH